MDNLTQKRKRDVWAIRLIVAMRSLTVGLAYFLIRDMPGLTSSFVAIFTSLLAFDLIVSMQKFSLRLKHWRRLFTMLLPRISATTIALTRGLVIGAFFGSLAQLGLPLYLGGVFTIGFGYHFVYKIKGNISTYVGMLAGLTVYDQIIRIPQLSSTLLMDVGGVVLQVVYTTFTALFMGWLCGIIVGILTRLVLPRGFMTVSSSAYDLPLSMQPMKDVLHTDKDMSVVKITVHPDSPLAYKKLENSRLREDYQTTVLSIYRTGNDIATPLGQDEILPDDTLVLVIPAEYGTTVFKLLRGSETADEQV